MDRKHTNKPASSQEAGPLSAQAAADTSIFNPTATEGTVRSEEDAFQTLLGLAHSLSAELDLQPLIRLVLDSARQVFGADRGILLLGRGDELGLVTVQSFEAAEDQIAEMERATQALLQKGARGEVVISENVAQDPRLPGSAGSRAGRMQSVLCAPLFHNQERIGAIFLDAARPRAFPPDCAPLLRAFAELAAITLENARSHGELLRENAWLRRLQPAEQTFDRLVGSSHAMVLLRRRAQVAAALDGPVLILGERGTGRELLARAIHDAGVRSTHPFVSFDCAAMPSDDLASLIFGRTGTAAARTYGERTGIIPRADLGTLYIGAAERLDRESAERILGVMRESRYRPVGGRRDVRIDTRVILGVSMDPRDQPELDHLSRDLVKWSRPVTLRLPSLRERMIDVPELVSHFISRQAQHQKRATPVFTPEAMQLLQNHYWPENVSELERVVHRALLLGDRKTLSDADVKRSLLPSREEQDLLYGPWTGRVVPMDVWEKEAIRQAMLKTKGNRSEASKLLGFHRNTLVRKIKEYALE